MALVRKGTQQNGQVGNSIGERRRIKSDLRAQVAPQRAAVHKPLDKFAGVASGKNKAGLAGFDPNATFKQARRFNSKATPYKRALHDHIEKGTAPVAGNKKPPSDRAILNFLDKVIMATPKQQVARSSAVQRAKANTGVQGAPRQHRQAVANPKARTNRA
jgi:hypothetical protein